MGSLAVGCCSVGLHVLRRRLGSASCARARRAPSVAAGCSRCHSITAIPLVDHGDSGVPRGLADRSSEPAVPAVESQHIQHLARTAERVARLAEKGLLTNEEVGRLSDELADCLKLHRHYMAAIEGHAAVVMADCVQNFRCDEQLANVLSTLQLTSLSSQAALPTPVEEVASDPTLLTTPADAMNVQDQGDLLRNIEHRMQLEDIGKVEPSQLADINDLPPWPWDPLPVAESEPSAERALRSPEL